MRSSASIVVFVNGGMEAEETIGELSIGENKLVDGAEWKGLTGEPER